MDFVLQHTISAATQPIAIILLISEVFNPQKEQNQGSMPRPKIKISLDLVFNIYLVVKMYVLMT